VMLAAQGYQESTLNQDLVSPRGAVGVMQVLPQYAAANPINISNVRDPQENIHAGAKMLAQITKTYFNDPAIDQMNKTLFTFAAYNAGQNRIVRLRKQAQEEGLDPNKWFGNVELMVAKDIGQETVQYVSNIYKYYVARYTSPSFPASGTGSCSAPTSSISRGNSYNGPPEFLPASVQIPVEPTQDECKRVCGLR